MTRYIFNAYYMDYSEFKEILIRAFSEKIGVDLDEKKCQMFFDFMNLLIEKNKVMNLTTIVEPSEVIMKHFVDSCMFYKFIDKINSGKTFVDVGTGAGFPGLPLAIVNDNDKFVLTDTLGKRINFLDEVIKTIGVKNVKLVKARVEDFAHDKNYREQFDYVVARGVARISVLSEYLLPCAKVGGKMIAYKMDDCQEELNDGKKAISTLGGMFHVKHSYKLLDDEPERCLLEIDKVKSTPKQYPRKAGTPSKSPIWF